jgi:hypothetical protein
VREYLWLTKHETSWHYSDARSISEFRQQITSAETVVKWPPRLSGVVWEISGTVEIHEPPRSQAPGTVTPLSEQITALVRERDGRNLACWPVLSFGWKDADLEPGGCTGIKAIAQRGKTLLVEVGGHKTFSYTTSESIDEDIDDAELDERVESRATLEWEFLADACTGYSCEGDAEDFTASIRDEIAVRLRKVPIERTVAAVIRAAEKRCDAFEHEMTAISEEYDKL